MDSPLFNSYFYYQACLIEKLKGQPDIKECFIPLMKLDVASNVLLKHLGYKWVGESIGTVKDKVYYSQVSWRTFFCTEQKDRKVCMRSCKRQQLA